ncbi:conserved protein, unknown function [Hepatocystis sp. ex Piliocolobus tephrosceles]|nr:conserved protein, unknown function [Hepatocystis sp. ex Piliocolobus tephrosceles]
MSTNLWKVILKDDVTKFENVLKCNSDIDLNSYNKDGLCFLLYAISNRCSECCTFLINECNVNIHLKDKKNNENALMKCMEVGNEMLNISKLLIKKNININDKDINGKSSLHFACEHNNLKGIELLLKQNADINITDNMQNTPLLYALKKNKEEAAMLLIDNNADVNAKDKDMNTPLHICAKEHLSNVAQYILATNKVDIKNCLDKDNNTPLHITAKEDLKKLCDVFIKYKMDEFVKNNNNETYKDIFNKREKNAILLEEEKKKKMEEKEMKKKQKMEEDMLKTEVSNFLITHNLQLLMHVFYKHNYIYLDKSFLEIRDAKLKKMNVSKHEKQQLYAAINKYTEQMEREKLENDEEYQRTIQEQKRTTNLKYVIFVVTILFSCVFVYSLIMSIVKRGKVFF